MFQMPQHLLDMIIDQQEYSHQYALTGKQEYKDIADQLKQEVQRVTQNK